MRWLLLKDLQILRRSPLLVAALIVPADVVDRLQRAVDLGGGPPPTPEVLYNVEDPLKAQAVQSAIRSRLADANRALSDRLTEVASGYLDILLRGGSFSLLGQRLDVLGPQRSKRIVDGSLGSLPPDRRADLRRVATFAQLAIDNLELSGALLSTISAPVHVKQVILKGRRTPLDAFAVAVAVSLLFVAVLLAAGSLALEREEHAFARLVRGLVTRRALLAEKIALSATCAFAVTLLMLCGIGIDVHLDWSRFPLWLLAFLLSLPVALLALVPGGAVSAGLYDVIRAISAAFPFKAALQAVDAAVNDAEPTLPGPLLHLAALAAAYAALARAALVRFA